jgi:hypothetical protein
VAAAVLDRPEVVELPSSVAALADLELELAFLLTTQTRNDTSCTTGESCQIQTNLTTCCATRTLSGAICCQSPAP